MVTMTYLSALYPVFDSPHPTLLTHTELGIGIFIAHPKATLEVIEAGLNGDRFELSSSNLTISFPVNAQARDLLVQRGGLLTFTDEKGMPWFTFSIDARPLVGEEGEFSL